MKYAVSITEFPANRTITEHFEKFKDAVEYLKMCKKLYKNAYFVLYFDQR